MSLELEGIFSTTTSPGKSPVHYMRQCVSSVHSRSGHTGSKTQCFCCSVTQSCLTFATPWTAVCQASLSFTISWSLFKLMSIESVMPANHFLLCCSLLLLPSILPRIRVFSNGLASRIRWPSIGASASVSILPMNIQIDFL